MKEYDRNAFWVIVAALGVICLGFAVLCGWVFDIEELRSVLPGLVSMKVNAAVSFILCGVSLMLLTVRKVPVFLLASQLAGLLCLCIALVTLAEYALDWHAGIDELLFNEPDGMHGRMSIIAALLFALQSSALLLMAKGRYWLITQALALLSGVIALLPIGGYLFGNLQFPHMGNSAGIAAHAALGFFVLAIAILHTTARYGVIRSLHSEIVTISVNFAFVILLIAIIAVFHSLHARKTAISRVENTYKALQLSQHIISSLFEHKAINRSALLTGDEQGLKKCLQVRNQIFSHLRELQYMANTRSDVDKQVYLIEIEPLLTQLFRLADQLLEARRTQRVDVVANLLVNSELDTLHANLISKLADAAAAERALLTDYKNNLALKEAIATTIAIIALSIGLLLLLTIFAALTHQIKQRELSEQQEKSRSHILELLANGAPLATILTAIIEMVEQQNPEMLCSVLLLDKEGKHLLNGAAPHLPDFYNAAIHGVEIGQGVGSCGTAAFTCKLVIVEDIQTHPYWSAFKEIAQQAKLASCWSAPIYDCARKVIGTFAIYHHKPCCPTPEQLFLIEENADLASIAIERIQVMETLVDSEDRFRSLFTQAPLGVALIDSVNGKIYKANQKYADIVGLSIDELQHLDWMKITYPDDIQTDLDNVALMNAGKTQGFSMEKRYIRADGSIVWVNLTVARLHLLEHGHPCHHCIVEDISARKQTELALLESEQRWKFALEGAGDGVWDWNIETNESLYSKQWKEMLGYTDNDILPSNDEWKNRIHPTDTDRVAQTLNDYLSGKIDSYVVEYRLRCKDGSYKWILGRGMVVRRDETGKPLRMVGTHSDITPRKNLEAELIYQAHYDYLTGLYNRRHFMEYSEIEFARTRRYQTPLSLLMLDIDYFKQFNDQYGHKAGDLTLQVFSTVCQKTVRKVDMVGRLGGEEFAVLLPETNIKEAVEAAERLRFALAQAEVKLATGDVLHFTVSVGVARLTNERDIDELLNKADHALYHAKETGRNKISVFACNC